MPLKYQMRWVDICVSTSSILPLHGSRLHPIGNTLPRAPEIGGDLLIDWQAAGVTLIVPVTQLQAVTKEINYSKSQSCGRRFKDVRSGDLVIRPNSVKAPPNFHIECPEIRLMGSAVFREREGG